MIKQGLYSMKRILGALPAAWLFITSALAQSQYPNWMLPFSVGGSGGGGGSGTVTSVSASDGLFSVGTPTTTPALSVAGTSGGIPYFNSATTWASSAALGANLLMKGGGAGAAPSTFTLGGDCTFSTPNITCTSINGKTVTLSAALTATGGATTLAFGAGANTYTFPNSSDTVATLAATQTLTHTGVNGTLGKPSYGIGASLWYANPYATGAVLVSNTGTTNSYYCAPFWISETVTIKALGITVVATSAGNTNSALQGAVYADLLTTGNVHRPGTFIDYAGSGVAGFTTSSATAVSATMANGTDILTGPGLIWTCVQKFDTTATYMGIGFGGNGSIIGAVLGSATLTAVLSSAAAQPLLSGVSTTGTTYGSAGWVNFTSSTTWGEQKAGQSAGPAMAIQVN